jgi:uncharacterized protein (DUF1330 family)
MAAYFVLMQQVDDIERYRSEYVPGVVPLLAKHGGELVVGGFDAEAVEGEPPNSTIVIRFPDEDAARAFLDDPEYRPARELRFALTSQRQGVIAPGFQARS